MAYVLPLHEAWRLVPLLTELVNFTTFDIMADLTFGESLNQLTDASYHPWVRAIFSHIKMIALSRVSREWPGISQLFQAMLPKDAKEKQKQHLRFSSGLLDKRMAREPEQPDIWSFVTRNDGKEEALRPTELYSNGKLCHICDRGSRSDVYTRRVVHVSRH